MLFYNVNVKTCYIFRIWIHKSATYVLSLESTILFKHVSV